jgi:uncharacterized protein YcbK (DUF882 family)
MQLRLPFFLLLICAPISGCGLWRGEVDPGLGQITLEIQRTHERDHIIYRDAQGRLLDDGLLQASIMMRDINSNNIVPTDPSLLDFLVRVRGKLRLEPRTPFIITSAYRDPTTNKRLRQLTGGKAAENSYHLKGMAVDIKINGVDGENIADAAKSLKLGGVAYYPSSDHVHIDSGPARTWRAY